MAVVERKERKVNKQKKRGGGGGGEDNCLGKKWDIAFHKGKYIFGRPTNYCLSTDMVRIAH